MIRNDDDMKKVLSVKYIHTYPFQDCDEGQKSNTQKKWFVKYKGLFMLNIHLLFTRIQG